MSGFTLACILKVQYKLDVTGVTDTTSRIWIIHAFVLKCIIHSTGGPRIVPFYVLEKYGVMQNSTLQDVPYSAIYKWYNARNI